MRVPLIVLITIYSVATLGMTLIPGVTPDGEPWRMSFFHAFYFVSFMGTTIGFGEIPYEFTDLQRGWVLVCIYTSVIAWLYSIGSVLRLVQDETFLLAVTQRGFQRSIMKLDSPFYIICGYGKTGEMVNQGLCGLGIQTVILDISSDRIATIGLGEFTPPPISLTADITDPNNLIAAGINSPHCQGVIVLTNLDHTNLEVAVSCKLVNPDVKVISRSEVEDEAKNMASFGTDLIINPYLTFAQRLQQLTTNPQLHQIQNWFINQYSSEYIAPNIQEWGLSTQKWIICGYGRLGKAIHQALDEIVEEITVVVPDPIASRAPDNSIIGRGTEAETLIEAKLEQADVIIAATEDDANNLSIIMTAKQIKPSITTIGRVSKESNRLLFEHADCNYIVRRSLLVANEVLTAISRPLVIRFIKFSNALTKEETSLLAQRVESLVGDQEPVTWRMCVDKESSPEIVDFIRTGSKITIGKTTNHHPIFGGGCIPLLLLRNGVSTILPENDEALKVGDQLLVCGPRNQILLPQRLQHNIELLDTLINDNTNYIPLVRWFKHRQRLKQHQ